jgi:hypothetical protein
MSGGDKILGVETPVGGTEHALGKNPHHKRSCKSGAQARMSAFHEQETQWNFGLETAKKT